MRILPRILLHLFITLLLVVAACWSFVLQWDATTDMQNTLVQGRDVFQYMERIKSRFEALNTAWKVDLVAPVKGKPTSSSSLHAAESGVGAEEEKALEKAWHDQVDKDVADAEGLYVRLLAALESSSRAGSRPVRLPLLEALFGKPKDAAATSGGDVAALDQPTGGSDAKPDGVGRPRRAGLAPWSEDRAVEVRQEMDKAYVQLDESWKNDKDMAISKARSAQVRGLTALLITAPLTLLSSLLVIRAIRNPLLRLMAATEEVAAGRFPTDLPVTGKDEISRLAGAFNKMSAELARAKKREADFLSVAAHELKTPLTLIRVFAGRVRSLLPANAEQAEAVAHLARIDTEVDQLSRKVLDLLDLGVIEAGQLSLEMHELPAKGFLAMAAGAFKPIAAAKAIQYEITIDPSVPTLAFDPDRMNQVLLNLLDNAFKFTSAGGRIHFGAKAVDGKLEIVVTDTGPGIPSEQLEEIFEKYARARSIQGKRQTKGAGLGLAVARGIVTAHGGTIEARSAPGKGSSFIVRLPIQATRMGKEVA